MFSQRIKKGFGLSEVSTLTPADASGLTVRSTDAGTHKIDGFTFKNDRWLVRTFGLHQNMVQAIRSGEKGLPGDPTAAKALSSFDQCFHPRLK